MINTIKSLPPLPSSVMKIQELCSEHDMNVSHLIDVIRNDPMLSANILKAVNSPLYGMSKEITSIRQAAMLFGAAMIRGFAVSSAIKKTVFADFSPYGIDIEHLGEVSSMQLALVREWYSRVDKSLLQSLMEAAFLMELGKVISAIKLFKLSAGEAFLSQLNEGKSIHDVELKYLEMSSYELAALMFEHWNFDEMLVSTLRAVADPFVQEDEKIQKFGKILHVVKEAANVRDMLTEESLQAASIAIEHFHLDKKSFNEAVAAVRANAKA
ncbi:MAG TPA: HDOD domain-containing protein [Sulfuricurvum sp.]|nr:HDOD domain-containing protein [Sulfuricurvum sp.]